MKLFQKMYESDDATLMAEISKIRDVPDFTMEELKIVLKKMKNGTTQDMSHIIVEMIKKSGLPFLERLLQM